MKGEDSAMSGENNIRPNKKQFIYTYLLFLYFLSCRIVNVTAIDDTNADFALAGYLPDYRLRAYLYPQINERKNIATTRPPMTDLMIFSLQPHARGFFACCLQEDHYELVEEFVNSTVPSPFSSSPSIRVWITLGGGGRTDAFPEICASSRLRQRLIGSIMNLSSRYSFIGGIDLDFFQPRTIEERDNYLLFLTEAITQWHHQGLKVSLTLHPQQGRMIPASVYKLLDRIHFMTYDMIRGNTDPDGSDYHASLSKVRQAVEELLQQGGGLERTPQKVLLGIPAYARHLRNPSQVKTFGEIHDGIRAESDSDVDSNSNPNPSEETKRFVLGDPDSTLYSWQGYEWESPARIRAKINLAKELKLGGVFFWELGQDKTTDAHPTGVLLETAAAAISGNSSAAYLGMVKNQGMSEL